MPNNVSGRRMIDDPLDVAAREPGACGDDGLSDREPVDLRISPSMRLSAMRWPYSSQTATLTFTLSCRAFAIAAFTIESASARVSVTTRNIPPALPRTPIALTLPSAQGWLEGRKANGTKQDERADYRSDLL